MVASITIAASTCCARVLGLPPAYKKEAVQHNWTSPRAEAMASWSKVGQVAALFPAEIIMFGPVQVFITSHGWYTALHEPSPSCPITVYQGRAMLFCNGQRRSLVA